MSDEVTTGVEQMTLSGGRKSVGKPCSHHGKGYNKGCTNDATHHAAGKFGAVTMEMDICEGCLDTFVKHADEIYEKRPLHDQELIA